MRTVQLSLADTPYAAKLREALSRSGPWQLKSADRPDLSVTSVVVLDEPAFARLPLPLSNPERIVLITRQDPQTLAQAWEAGIVSVVFNEDPIATVLLAIMAAALRVGTGHQISSASGISPTSDGDSAPITPDIQNFRSKRCKFR